MRFCGYIYIGDYNTAHELTIRYNANGGEINGGDYCVDDDMICYSDDYSVVKEVWEEEHGIEYGLYNSSTFGLEKDGYEFLGWSLSPDSGQIFGEDEDLISNDIYPDITDESVTVTMYARWSRYAVTIEYNANGGTISEGDCRVGSGGDIYNDDELVTETWEEGCGHQWGLYNAGTFKLKRTNCDFLGWSLKPDSGRIFGEDEQLISNDIYPEVKDHSGTVKLYAQWGGHTMTEAESEGKTLPDGDYWIVNALDPNYIVHPDSDGAAVNGTNVRMNLYDNSEWSKNDLFTVKYLDNGFYSITQNGTDMAISTENNSLRHRTNIIMLPKSDKELCQWTIRRTTNGYFVQSKSNALYFDVKNDATNNSTLQTFEFNGTKSQIFDFISFKDVHKHSYKEKIILPTCTEDGTKKFSCECGDTYTEIIPATGHEYTKEIVEATCTEDGYAKNTCHNCGDTYTETIPATGHKYVTTTVTPTDTKAGYDLHTCSVCGDFYIDNVVPAVSAQTNPTVSFEKGDSCAKLTWAAVSSAQMYGIAGYQNGEWQLLDKTTDTSYILKNLKAGTEYQIAVIAKFNDEWNMDFSNAITVTPKEATVNLYPAVQTQVKDSKIGFKWTKVPGAEKYGIGIYQANKWKVIKQLDGSVSTWTSPQVRNDTYRLVVLAKVDGQWVNADVFKKAFYVTVS